MTADSSSDQREVGDLLVEQGKLTASQLDQVRRRQKRLNRKVGLLLSRYRSPTGSFAPEKGSGPITRNSRCRKKVGTKGADSSGMTGTSAHGGGAGTGMWSRKGSVVLRGRASKHPGATQGCSTVVGMAQGDSASRQEPARLSRFRGEVHAETQESSEEAAQHGCGRSGIRDALVLAGVTTPNWSEAQC